jgi:hypothetical protein|uniref:Uncharacterized protein n=1 Tax=viral metagenome TaxID=1070528 RepID=A0A6C0HKG4_9ZZZZ
MTSVLYSAGLNYQSGNPVRSEIVALRREVDSLRKQVEQLSEEALVYRKHLIKLVQESDGGAAELTADLQRTSASVAEASREPVDTGRRGTSVQGNDSRREVGGGTVQGSGFRR